jgi:MAP7 domain-containing protein 1
LAKHRAEELRREAEEAESRKVEMEALVKQAMAERKRKEMEEQEAEIRKSAELEEKKRVEKEKRMEQSRRSEDRRKERSKLAEELVNKEKHARHQADEERRMRIKLARASVTGKMEGGETVAGWVTLQTNEFPIWRRRYFEFIGSTWMFYRSAQDTHTILDQVDLYNRVDSLREWFEGYEELKAIPHSFAIQFRDGQGSWSVFSDSEEEKYILLGLLLHASNL